MSKEANSLPRERPLGGAAGEVCGSAGLSGLAAVLGLCCVAPWAVALFGVGGAVLLARFEPLRPFMLGAAVLILAWAFWRTYRNPARGFWIQVALWSAAALVALSFFAEDLALLFVDIGPPAGGR